MVRDKKTWYLCDPAKNKGCEKTFCVHNPNARRQICDSTSNIEYAKLDDMENPIISKEEQLQLAEILKVSKPTIRKGVRNVKTKTGLL